MDETDAQLHLKKRARRRLVGAVAFVSVVAVVLPMVMDNQPRQVVQDVEIRIPGQDEKPFAPKFATPPAARPQPAIDDKPLVPAPALPPVATAVTPVSVAAGSKAAEMPSAKVDGMPPVQAAEKAQAKPPEKPVKAEKPPEKPVAKDNEAQRAAAILAGKADLPPGKAQEYLVLIGAFSNEANVRNLKEKLTQLGIKSFSEPLETPQGKKMRVRAGPFATPEAAEKALAKMKTIGVTGVVAAK
jgi:DedD protein